MKKITFKEKVYSKYVGSVSPATKGDLLELKNLINTRFFEVHNIPHDIYGRKAYFDMGTGNIVYYDSHQNSYLLPI